MWDTVIEDALSRGDWDFAMVTVQLDESTSTTVIPGFNYAFDHPDDWIRTVAYSFDADFTGSYYNDQDADIHHERGSYFCNTDQFYLRYISSDYAADSEIEDYPPSFVEFVACLLAERSCERITQGTEKQDDLEEKCEKALLKAKSNDARNLKQKRVRRGNWLRAFQGDSSRRGAEGTLVGGEIDTTEGST